jgi:hypothetical protein
VFVLKKGAGANDTNGGILRSLHFTKTDPLGPSLVTSTHPSPLSLAGRARKCTTTDGVFDDDDDDGSSVVVVVVVFSVATTMRSIASESSSSSSSSLSSSSQNKSGEREERGAKNSVHFTQNGRSFSPQKRSKSH